MSSAVAVQTKGFGYVVVGVEVGLDRGDQVWHGVEDSPKEGFVDQLAEPAHDQVQP